MRSYAWSNKQENMQKAQEHTKMVEDKYNAEVAAASSQIYGPNRDYNQSFEINDNMITQVVPMDTVSALYKYHEGKTALLNFASYRHPGGMFIEGSQAQEECLCHESILYNVLRQYQPYYDWNEKNRNKSLYLDRAIYSEHILFIKKGMKPVFSDVITCACPNKKAAQKYAKVTNEENSKVLDERIHFLLDIAAEYKVDTLILGAFGCGVFGQDPYEVAEVFKKYLNEYKCFKKVIFAVPRGMNDFNNLAFAKTFN
jgi:uncharacterized protein (TIGR02452 family)